MPLLEKDICELELLVIICIAISCQTDMGVTAIPPGARCLNN